MENKPEVVEVEEKEYNKRDKIKYILIYAGVFVLAPTIIGISLTLIFQNYYLVEAVYTIFGCLSILLALFKSHRRDSKNIRKTHTIVEDKDASEYRQYSFQQWISYIAGAISLVLAIASFYIMNAMGLFS